MCVVESFSLKKFKRVMNASSVKSEIKFQSILRGVEALIYAIQCLKPKPKPF